MGPESQHSRDRREGLLALYDSALPQVYRYLLARCRSREVAEDLTAETFLAAADAARCGRPTRIDAAWLVGVARHKLADHWRRQAREQRRLVAFASRPGAVEDPWDVRIDAFRAADILAELAPQHRLALTLRYVDDLPVADVAQLLGRTLHATEALLVRARAAFRAAYLDSEEGDRG